MTEIRGEFGRVVPWDLNMQRQGQLLVAVTGPGGQLPTKTREGDAGYDLYVSKDTWVPAEAFVDIHCGISVQLPAGMWGRITGRSSTLRKRGLLVNEAVIDNGYIGPIYTGVWNLSTRQVTVRAGERLAQLVLHPIATAEVQLVVADELHSRDGRGDAGFGSSGQ